MAIYKTNTLDTEHVSEGSGPTLINTEGIFDTVSCPCGSRMIKLENEDIGCERNNFGKIKVFNPIYVHNHKINSEMPKIGDQWRCVGVKCKKGDFEWNALHVVSVVKSNNDNASSLLDSIISTSNCYIPKSEIYTENNEIFWTEDNVQRLHQEMMEAPSEIKIGWPTFPNSGFNIQDTLGHINENPIFATSEQAQWYNLSHQVSADLTSVTAYSENGISGFIPGLSTGNEKIINTFKINGKKTLAKQ